MNNARTDNTGNALDITVTSETADSEVHNKVNSENLLQHISSKEDILKELASLYCEKLFLA
jgi:hypothetical protein